MNVIMELKVKTPAPMLITMPTLANHTSTMHENSYRAMSIVALI